MSEKRGKGPFIRFVDENDTSRKTRLWRVETTAGAILGTVKWWGAWRGYAFFPGQQTLYEHRCLRDIASFVEFATKAHRDAVRARRKP